MLKTHLPSDIKEEYLDLKYKRDFCLKNGASIAAFYHQVQIIEFYNALPRKYQKQEEIADHYQIAHIIVQDCFGNNDESLFSYLYDDVTVALGYKASLRNFPNYDYMINAFCTHINIVKFLYLVENPHEEIRQYIDKLISAYRSKYGQQNDVYLKLCLHLLFEGIFPSDYQYAMNLFNEHYGQFVSHLMGYDFTYEVFLAIATDYTEGEDFDNANNLLDIAERASRHLSDSEKQKNVRLQCAWRRARILSLQGQHSKSEMCCTDLLKIIIPSHPIFPEICNIMMANCTLTGRDNTKWIEKGLSSCEELNYTNSLTYYRLLAGLAAVEYQKGNVADAISYAREVIDGMESTSGKESNTYIMALFSYFAYLDNERAKKDFLNDILDTIRELNNSFVKAFAYNILASLGYNELGESTLNIAELEQVAKNAVEASNSTTTEYLKIATRINLLRLIVGQIKRYSQLKNEIAQLFSYLEAHKSKMDTVHSYSFNVCYIIYYCTHGNPQRALEIANSIKYDIAAISAMPELLRDFDRVYVEVLLANKKEREAITVLNSQIDLIAKNLQKANDFTAIAGYLLFAFSIVSQHGNGEAFYSELSYKCALMLKYINVKFHPDFNRSEANLDISRQISALELRKTNIDSLKNDSDIQSTLKALRYKLDYSSNTNFRMPMLKDIALTNASVLLDICLFFEYKHGDFTSSRDDDEKILSVKLAIFAIYNDNGGCRQVERLQDVNLDTVSKIFETDDDTYSSSDLRRIYDMFFGQFEKHLVGCDTLYLSLDYMLPVIPFGALLDYTNTPVADKYNLINVFVATDIRADFSVALKDVLLMGNPKYGINEKYVDERDDLPYTAVEVNLIENLVASPRKYLQERANKNAFYDNKDASIIHISSHGKFGALTDREGSPSKFDPNELQTPLIGSSILLSGCADFIHSDKADGYGNGLLTAEDVIGLNLDNTSLIVLSACESGAGYSDDSTSIPKGMRWAMGFTGARASITSIYKVGDIQTAIFMVLYYRNLKNFPVARSLSEAKKQMRNLTVRDIKLDRVLYSAFGHELTGLRDGEKPFSQLEYWCAFDCYFYGGVL